MSKGESRKTKRARAAKERAREAHVKLFVERQGDPRFVQQIRTSTGRTIHLRPQDVEMLREQKTLFKEKFGREPGEDDPLFFDPTKDVPTEMDQDATFAEIRDSTVRAGLDPAFIDAWHEVGYMITDENQHLFSAHEVEAYLDAVQRAWDHDDDDDDDDDDDAVIDLSQERIATARARVLERLGLSDDDAIAAARHRLGAQLGTIIAMGSTEGGDALADVEIIRVGIHAPYESHSVQKHIEDVALTLREESLDWLDGVRKDYVDNDRMPAMADFIALSDDDQLAVWVRQQMTGSGHDVGA